MQQLHQNIHIHCMHCIMPPHMLEAIKLRGTLTQRRMVEALETEARDYRQSRETATPQSASMAAPVLRTISKIKADRVVYDGQNKSSLPGKIVRTEGQSPTSDPTVNEVYDGAGAVYDLYLRQYRRNSLDGKGLQLVQTVHHKEGYNNAFWNGSQMVYGDGDGILFQKLTELTVIGHEFSHGVVQFSGGLKYRDQSGALNESFADIFGCLTEQYRMKQEVNKASWLVGRGIFGPNINGEALRSMKAPGLAYEDSLLGKDPQPFHMDYYMITSEDLGGVHINSGIPNHAFFLLAQYLGGNAWEKAGQIWYDTMQAINNPLATFQDWAEKTVEMANARYTRGSIEAIMTRRAWKLVGISV